MSREDHIIMLGRQCLTERQVVLVDEEPGGHGGLHRQ
jgi:hypothetical protein